MFFLSFCVSLVSFPQLDILGAQIAFLGAPAMRAAAGLLLFFQLFKKKEFFVFKSSCGASIANRDFERSKWLARRHFVRTLNGQFDKERRRCTFYRKNRRTIAIFQKSCNEFCFLWFVWPKYSE